MQITFTLHLPRDEASVPMVRHICRDALDKLGVDKDCVGDIELAVTEACTNVLDHAHGTGDEYEVRVEADETTCQIRVVDTGAGFDHELAGRDASPTSAESGRGIFLMRAVVDDLSFVSQPESGTMVHLVKKLALRPGSLLEKLTASGSARVVPALSDPL